MAREAAYPKKIILTGVSPHPKRIAAAAKKLSSARFVAEVQNRARYVTGPQYEKAIAALQSLQESLPIITCELSEIRNRWDGDLVEERASAAMKDIVSIQKTADKLGPALTFFSGKNMQMPKTGAWRDIVLDLADVYFEMRGSAVREVSNTGPAARFVAAVIPFITGESPNIGNVGKALMRANSKDKTKGDNPRDKTPK